MTGSKQHEQAEGEGYTRIRRLGHKNPSRLISPVAVEDEQGRSEEVSREGDVKTRRSEGREERWMVGVPM